jgi:hypothetical protein
MRAKGDVKSVPADLVDPRKAILYRSCFDQFGFYDLQPLNSDAADPLRKYRAAYRKLWIEELAGYSFPQEVRGSSLNVLPQSIAGLDQVAQLAREGVVLIERLVDQIRDPSVSGQQLSATNNSLSELDRKIEQTGFHFSPLGPITRMFCFAKENIQGTDAMVLASQMRGIYDDLLRRSQKLASYYSNAY